MIKIKEECQGYYKIEAVKPDGSRRILADWFPNLILDSGLNRMGSNSNYLTNCQVGSGSSAPATTQTALVSLTASTSTILADNPSNSGSDPYFARRTITYRFGQGVAAGVLSEVGVGWAATGSLFSRALILDSLGTPTTITVLADESLDVTYELRMYAWVSLGSGSINLNGVDHTFTTKSALAAQWNLSFPFDNAGYTESRCFGFTGTVSSTIDGSPSGVLLGEAQCIAADYTPGSFSRTLNITAGLANWNNASGIGAIQVLAGWSRFQIGFSPSIMKTSTQILTLQVRHSWGRKA